VSAEPGVACVYGPAGQPGAGEVDLPDRDGAVDATAGHSASNESYTWNVRVFGGDPPTETDSTRRSTRPRGAPPAPQALEETGPPG
jgi:hypothetical protein